MDQTSFQHLYQVDLPLKKIVVHLHQHVLNHTHVLSQAVNIDRAVFMNGGSSCSNAVQTAPQQLACTATPHQEPYAPQRASTATPHLGSLDANFISSFIAALVSSFCAVNPGTAPAAVVGGALVGLVTVDRSIHFSSLLFQDCQFAAVRRCDGSEQRALGREEVIQVIREWLVNHGLRLELDSGSVVRMDAATLGTSKEVGVELSGRYSQGGGSPYGLRMECVMRRGLGQESFQVSGMQFLFDN